MTASYFVDSNVLIYARDLTEGAKQERASDWIESLAQSNSGRLSFQVLSETYSTLTRKRSHMTRAAARLYVANFVHWRPIVIDAPLMGRAWEIEYRFRLNWWDCLIVAAAQMAECRYLLTEDLQAGQQFGGLAVIDPFETAPGGV